MDVEGIIKALRGDPIENEDIIKALNLPNRLMTENEVVEARNCSVQKLRNDRCAGVGLPYIKDGRNVRYVPVDVAAHILKNRIVPGVTK